MNNPFANVSFKDLSRAAVYLSGKIIKANRECSGWWNRGSEHLTLSLAVWKMLCELKEFREVLTRPEDLIQMAAYNMRAYECRRYPRFLEILCRSVARQFADFDGLASKSFEHSWDDHWKFYSYSNIKTSDRAARKIFVAEDSRLEEFGNVFVCEEWAAESTEIAGIGGCIVDKWEVAKVIPFNSHDEAVLFVAQLADLLNTGGEPDCPAAAQFIRDTVAQAPVEQMRMELERKAAEQAKREEEERRRKEFEQQAAIARAKREESIRQGVHVYVLDLGNGTVKIGISNNVRSRIAQAQTFGLKVVRFAVTQQGFKESQALKIESACHKYFKDKSVTKEVFNIPYDEAKAHLQTYAPIIEPDEQG